MTWLILATNIANLPLFEGKLSQVELDCCLQTVMLSICCLNQGLTLDVLCSSSTCWLTLATWPVWRHWFSLRDPTSTTLLTLLITQLQFKSVAVHYRNTFNRSHNYLNLKKPVKSIVKLKFQYGIQDSLWYNSSILI